MLSEILLIRHGRAAVALRGGWVSLAGFERRRDACDAAGLDPRDGPPASVIDAMAATELVVASDLPRALESARKAAASRQIVVSALLRETRLPVPPWLPVRMPVVAWDALTHARWGYHILRGTDARPADRQRVRDAVSWLCDLDGGGSSMSVVTHGVFRRLLANRLAELGWRCGSSRRSYRYWSIWRFARAAGRP